MPVTINGSGSITGFVAQTANIANGAIGTNQLANGAATQAKRTYAAGEVVQVKEYASTSMVTWSSGWTDTGLTGTITPQFSNSNIIATFYTQIRVSGNADHGVGWKILRDSTAIMTTASNYWVYNNPAHDGRGGHTISVGDNSHNSTSSLTYKLQFHAYRSDNNNSCRFCDNNNRASMMLIEVKA